MSLGIEDGRIQDSAITASTIHNSAHAAHLGRLNLVARSGKAGAWCAKTSNNKEWLQIDLGNPTTVTKVATQGRQDSNSRCSRTKQRQRNVQKSVLHVQSCFFAN